MQLSKVSNKFTALEQTITLAVPANASEVALRLYENGYDVSIFYLTDGPPAAETNQRSFYLTGLSEMPANFIKYIGSFLFPATVQPSDLPEGEEQLVDAHVVEVSS